MSTHVDPAEPSADPAPADDSLRAVWRSLSDPRQAACLAWLAFLVTWLITRIITIHGKDSGGGAAISIAGHHVHHYLFGIVILALTSGVAIFIKPRRGWEWLGVGYGVGLALILDEYALLLNLSDVYWSKQGSLSVDVVLAFIAAGAAYLTGMTWIHEAARRARHRVHRRRG